MKTATIDNILSWKPCSDYTEEIITELFAGRETLTVQDILELNISAKDKLWAILREDMLDAAILHEFACRCAEEALKLIDNPDPRSIAAIATKRAWLRGEITDAELSVAWTAARSAADAIWADAAYATYAAARDKQIEIIKEILKEIM